jgi:replicative DNA helicase
MSFWQDIDFQTTLTALICRDRNFLHKCSHLLEPDDFKPRKQGDPMEIWVVASKGLEFWTEYREPIGAMLRTEILDHCRKNRVSDKQKEQLLSFVAHIQKNGKIVAVDAMAEKVIEYKKERLKKKTIQELVDLQEQGKLDDDTWTKKCYDAVKTFGKMQFTVSDYYKNLETRISLRQMRDSARHHPYFLIDPLDELIKGPGRGHLAIWLAYLGMGKSIALNWMSMAYAMQGLNVLHITLEDPVEEVENRFDAAITCMATSQLLEKEEKVRERFARFLSYLRGRMKVVDGTDGDFSVARIDEAWERERNLGFAADVIIIDYDDEIKPPRKMDERRFEFADIYRLLRQMAARRQAIVWTAAQTGRKTEFTKIISTGMTAEDISKVRKARMAIGIGKGDWGEHSRYLYVAKNNFGRQHVGRHIVGNFDQTLFYDRVATLKEIDKRNEAKKKEEEVREV